MMEHLSYSPSFWINNQEQCIEKFKDDILWNSVNIYCFLFLYAYFNIINIQIPLVNTKELHNFKDNSLVRFHGMIQDMYNPEYYFEKYEVENEVTKEKSIKYGKYRDTTDLAVSFYNSNKKSN